MAQPDQLRLMAEHFPDEAGFVEVGREHRLTFAEWSAGADAAAAGLRKAGVAPGDRVGLLVPAASSVRWVVAYVAIHRAGAVAVPLNTRSTRHEVGAIVAHAGIGVLITGRELLELVERLDDSPLRLVVVVPATGPDPPSAPTDPVLPFLAWDDLVDSESGAVQVAVDGDDLADIVYTSGTTGRPKGVVVRHANASLLAPGVPTWSGSGWLSCSPLFTFAGLTAVDSPMKLGMTALYLPRFEVAAWLRAVEVHRPAMVFLVPAMVELLLADPAFSAADLSCIGLCAVGSAPLAPATWRRLAARMPEASVSNAYGMTEAGPAYTVLPKEETEARAGSVGRPLPPAEFFVVDDDGRRLGPGEVGELVIHLPGRAREYYRDADATARTWRPDGLHTGDLARIDEDGYVYVVGRAKEVIIRGGHNVHAADVEAVLYEHPAVVEAAVAGVEHPVLGEDVAAWVVLAEGRSDVLLADLRRYLGERLADYKVPRRITVVDQLPRNATGKVVRHHLRDPAQP